MCPGEDSKPGSGKLDRHGAKTVDTRFGGLAADVEESVNSSIDKHLGNFRAPFPVTPQELGTLSQERTREALAEILEIGCNKLKSDSSNNPNKNQSSPDPEAFDPDQKLHHDIARLVGQLRADVKLGSDIDEHSPEGKEVIFNADMAANLLTSVMLRSSPTTGIDPREVEHRKDIFGSNALTEKKLDSFCKLCWESIQDFVLIMLIVLGTISILVEVFTHEGDCKTCWIEGAAILVSVVIVVLITASIDYAKQFAFIRLNKSLNDTNTKQVIRDGQQVSVVDADIVVGDILSVNSHSLASIPCDCVLLGPSTSDLMMNESSLTGESELIRKRPGDVVLSGTTAQSGSAKMVVIAVGVHSVSGKIKARVYESNDLDNDLEGEDTESPLFVKLDILAKRIGMIGTAFAILTFLACLIIGLGIEGDDATDIVDYVVTAITVLAVSVPEGLPLAVTLALAFSSGKMMKEQNLVKHLDACETMGCATTICTDKTGTLTANKMTARAMYCAEENYLVTDPSMLLGDYIKTYNGGLNSEIIKLVCTTIAVDTMNETTLHFENKVLTGGNGNPTEVALLQLGYELGHNYETIRNETRGRSDQGALGAHLAEGKQFGFTSARKIMSWAVPMPDGGYRIFTKGAAEVVIARCNSFQNARNEKQQYSDAGSSELLEVSFTYARRGMRCLALSYRDLPEGFDLNAKADDVKNSDGSPAELAETDMTCIALIGIEDPLRKEVPGAIEKCYGAGIDVRMVTGDSPNTAVSIAYQAGIIRDSHFRDGTTERVADNLKENVLMEGKAFREQVHRLDNKGEKEFDQAAFDKIWPHLRVLARSSPDDKLTLAHGLNQSNLFVDKAVCDKLLAEDGIKIFPDRQVVAMTGDGTNDAPALKRADIGFAMGLAGTQIAKDAADIILLDDNFASIVTAARWGRNIYASIQKFLQFQLTVNIAAVCSAVVGAFANQESPLAAIQLLWINLLMDSLASLALASEPPTDALMTRPPVNRTTSMLTTRMRANMIGQAVYQVTVIMLLLFKGPEWFGLTPGHEYDGQENSVHYTLIFNVFVCMTLFNEINARKLKGERNVFEGILNNYIFCSIWVTTAFLQALIVEFGSVAFKVSAKGLEPKYWLISLAIGAGVLPWQQVINIFFWFGQQNRVHRSEKRKRRAGLQTTNRA